jgi:hypothetical protein
MSTPYNRTIKGIVIHHMGDGKSPEVSILHRWNPRGYDFPEYDFGIEFDGTIRIGRPSNIEGSHAIATRLKYAFRGFNWWNRNSIGIGLAGDFTLYPMPEAQFNSLVSLVLKLMNQYHLTLDDVYPHGQITATNCPGCTYSKVPVLTKGKWSYDKFEQAVNNSNTPVLQPTPQPQAVQPTPTPTPAPVQQPLKFSYPNNAKVVGDDLYIRDVNGTKIEGHFVANGDCITVLDVSFSRQLALVEYPTSSGVRSGYVKNMPSLIQYCHQDQWHNGSTSEVVYDENGGKLGSLNPREAATPLYRKNGKLHVVYNTDKGVNTKSSYVVYNGGFSRF